MPQPDDRDDLLAQLKAAAGDGLGMTHDELLASLNATPADDPLDGVEYSYDLETDAAREVSALYQAFRDRAAREDARFQEATDSEYWIALCFRTRDAKEAFLRAARLDLLGDKYLDGHQAARVLNITIEEN